METASYPLQAESDFIIDESFTVIPRNCDTAVVYWNLSNLREYNNPNIRLCLQINGHETDAEEMVILHRGSGHFIVPLLAEDREYSIALGWSDSTGFRALYEQVVRLPDYPNAPVGAMSTSMSFRGAHFWPKAYNSSVN